MIQDELRVKYLEEEDIESIALSIHNEKICSSFPFEVEIYLYKKYKYHIQPSSYLEASCRIDTAMIACRNLLRIDEKIYDDQYDRVRFSIAHELGHLVLHSNIIKIVVNLLQQAKKTDEYGGIVNSLSTKNHRRAEWQADFFAGCLLAPKKFLSEKIKELVANRKDVTEMEALDEENIDTICRDLSRYFGMTRQAIRVRITVAQLDYLLYSTSC